MVFGIALFIIAILIIYAVFFWMPGKESRKEEKENGKNKDGQGS
jgi:Flp pilus assembly protein TadB